MIFCSLVPRSSLLPRRPRQVWEGVGERTPSKYCQNTPYFSPKNTLVRTVILLVVAFRSNSILCTFRWACNVCRLRVGVRVRRGAFNASFV